MYTKKIIGALLTMILVFGQMVTVITAEEEAKHAYFGQFTGIVQEVRSHGLDDTMELVLLENEEGALANLVISEDTYIIGDEEMKVGQKVTGYYVADAPMIMIYPAQYPTKVAIVGQEEQHIKIDRFNGELVSDDNMLKLNDISEAEIVDEDGELFVKRIFDRQLIVFYDQSTKSIPAQTHPNKIVVLDRNRSISDMDIFVQGEVIEGPSAYEDEQGLVMVPIRAIAEALGYEVQWDNDMRKVSIGQFSEFRIGVNEYTFAKMMPATLDAPPVIVNDRSFVPLHYFTDVLQIQEAYVGEYEIIVNEPAVLYE